MKSAIILAALAGVLMLPVLTKAQGSPTVASNNPAGTVQSADVTLSLEMARKMMKITQGLTNNFADYKGDFVQKDDSGNSYYSVKGFDIGTNQQFVIQRTNGDYTYAALFAPKDDTDKIPVLAFTAFTGGIQTVATADFLIVKDDAAQPEGTLKFYLKAKGYKIASFTFNVNTKHGTLIVAIQ